MTNFGMKTIVGITVTWMAAATALAGVPYTGCTKTDVEFAKTAYAQAQKDYKSGSASKVDVLEAELNVIEMEACNDPTSIAYCTEKARVANQIIEMSKRNIESGLGRDSKSAIRLILDLRTNCPSI